MSIAALYREAGEFNSEYDDLMEEVSRYIERLASTTNLTDDVAAVINDAIAARGKMLRPKLLMLCASTGPDFKASRDRLCKLAAMVELTHIASLIHDDIIDDAPERRGRPSIQGRYGKKAAVYAGDFLMSRISYQVAGDELNRPGAVLARTVEEMCKGEMGQSRCLYRTDMTVEDYMRNIHGKTAALFMAACHIGAEEAGCNYEEVKRFERFGEVFGICFQLRDDLLDFTSETGIMGKEVHKDFKDGIYTYPVLKALSSPEGRKKLEPFLAANARGEITARDLKKIQKIVSEEGGIEETRAQIRKCLSEAQDILKNYSEYEAVGKILKLLQKLAIEVNHRG